MGGRRPWMKLEARREASHGTAREASCGWTAAAREASRGWRARWEMARRVAGGRRRRVRRVGVSGGGRVAGVSGGGRVGVSGGGRGESESGGLVHVYRVPRSTALGKQKHGSPVTCGPGTCLPSAQIYGTR